MKMRFKSQLWIRSSLKLVSDVGGRFKSPPVIWWFLLQRSSRLRLCLGSHVASFNGGNCYISPGQPEQWWTPLSACASQMERFCSAPCSGAAHRPTFGPLPGDQSRPWCPGVPQRSVSGAVLIPEARGEASAWGRRFWRLGNSKKEIRFGTWNRRTLYCSLWYLWGFLSHLPKSAGYLWVLGTWNWLIGVSPAALPQATKCLGLPRSNAYFSLWRPVCSCVMCQNLPICLICFSCPIVLHLCGVVSCGWSGCGEPGSNSCSAIETHGREWNW